MVKLVMNCVLMKTTVITMVPVWLEVGNDEMSLILGKCVCDEEYTGETCDKEVTSSFTFSIPLIIVLLLLLLVVLQLLLWYRQSVRICCLFYD